MFSFIEKQTQNMNETSMNTWYATCCFCSTLLIKTLVLIMIMVSITAINEAPIANNVFWSVVGLLAVLSQTIRYTAKQSKEYENLKENDERQKLLLMSVLYSIITVIAFLSIITLLNFF